MTHSRLRRVQGLLAAQPPELPGPDLCVLAARVVDVDGAGILLRGGAHQGLLCSSNPLASRVDGLCAALGEGPAMDASRQGVFALEPDLARPEQVRWPIFAPSALTAGVGAIFSFPLRVGSVLVGAMTLYNRRPGSLSDDQHGDALLMATIALHLVLQNQAGARPGDLADGLSAGAGDAEVHQASGMISAQLGVGVAEALVRLRARAYADDRPVLDVARDVVHRRLRLDA